MAVMSLLPVTWTEWLHCALQNVLLKALVGPYALADDSACCPSVRFALEKVILVHPGEQTHNKHVVNEVVARTLREGPFCLLTDRRCEFVEGWETIAVVPPARLTPYRALFMHCAL